MLRCVNLAADTLAILLHIHCNRYVEFKSIIRCQIVHLVDRSDLFKISNLVNDGGKL